MELGNNNLFFKNSANGVGKGLSKQNNQDNQNYEIPSQIPVNQSPANLNSNESFGDLKDLLMKQQDTIAEQARVIRSQHEEISKMENDVVLKSQRGLIMEVIGIADQIRYSLEDQEKERNYDTLLDSVKQLLDWTESTLTLSTVKKYEKLDSDEFDPKRQEIVEVVDTDNPALDGKLKSVLPGYVWQLPLSSSIIGPTDTGKPQSFDFMIRHQQMVKYKYVPSVDKLNKIF